MRARVPNAHSEPLHFFCVFIITQSLATYRSAHYNYSLSMKEPEVRLPLVCGCAMSARSNDESAAPRHIIFRERYYESFYRGSLFYLGFSLAPFVCISIMASPFVVQTRNSDLLRSQYFLIPISRRRAILFSVKIEIL